MADEGVSDAAEAGEADAPAKPKKKTPRPCERCGNFAKRQMILGQKLCAECAEKSLHPAADGAMSAGDLISGSLSIARVIAIPAMFVSLVPDALGAGLGMVAANAGADARAVDSVSFMFGALCGPLIAGFTILLAWRAVQREALEPGTALGQAFSSWIPLLGTAIVCGFSVLAYWLLLVIPGILRSLDVIVAPAVTLIEGRGPGDSMAESVERMKPFRGAIFGASLGLTFLCLIGAGFVIWPIWLLGLDEVEIQLATALLLPVVTSAIGLVNGALVTLLYSRERLLRKA